MSSAMVGRRYTTPAISADQRTLAGYPLGPKGLPVSVATRSFSALMVSNTIRSRSEWSNVKNSFRESRGACIICNIPSFSYDFGTDANYSAKEGSPQVSWGENSSQAPLQTSPQS